MRGNKPQPTVPLSRERFLEARKLKGIPLKELAARIDRSEKTLRNWISQGEIPERFIDPIAQILNVDPLFLEGFYDREIERRTSDQEEIHELKEFFSAQYCTYFKKTYRNAKPGQYITDILIENRIPLEKLQNLPKERQIQFFVDLDRAISTVLNRYFPNAGEELLIESYPIEGITVNNNGPQKD